MSRTFLCPSALLGFVLLSFATGDVSAQTVAPGPYYATPSWDQKLPCETTASCPRFIVLSNWNQEAVLDRETGLVWERYPLFTQLLVPPFDSGTRNWFVAANYCTTQRVGNRYGWRLPTIQELASLLDHPDGNLAFTLPPGHPFGLIFRTGETGYWTSTSVTGLSLSAWVVRFHGSPFSIAARTSDPTQPEHAVWCVRGGQGVDLQ